MSETPGSDRGDAIGFIRSLVGAWDCCGTCAGGVLASHDRQVAATALTEAAEAIEADLREAPNPSRQLRMWTNTHAAIVRGLIPTDSAIAGAP